MPEVGSELRRWRSVRIRERAYSLGGIGAWLVELRTLVTLLACVLILLPRAAYAETCISPPGLILWTSLCTPEWSSCDCSPDDDFIVSRDTTLVIPPDSDARTTDVDVRFTSGSLTVKDGGAVEIREGAQLEIPSKDLVVEAKGVFRAVGKVLGEGDPSWITQLGDSSDPNVNTAVRLQTMIECPGSNDDASLFSDCNGMGLRRAGIRSEIAACWSDVSSDPVRSRWLSLVRPGDVMVFWDPTDGLAPSRDVNSMYKVVSSAYAASAGCLIFEIRQGSGEESCGERGGSCRLTQRDILPVELAAKYSANSPAVSVRTGALQEDRERVGRWLTCPVVLGPDGRVRLESYTSLIIGSDVGGNGIDTLRLLPGGLPADIPQYALCYVDYGWMPGDVVSIFRPAVLGDGVETVLPSDGLDADIVCRPGSYCEFAFAVAENHGAWELWGPGSEHVVDTVWIQDGINTVAGAGVSLIDEANLSISRLQITSPRYYGYHGICVNGELSDGIMFQNLVFRYLGDDAIVNQCCTVVGSSCLPGGDQTIETQSYEARHVRATYVGGAGGSCGVVDSNLSYITRTQVNISIDGLVALDSECSDSETFNNHNSTSLRVHDAAIVGGRFVPFNAQGVAPAVQTDADHIYDVGRMIDVSVFGGDLWGGVRTLRDSSFIGVVVGDPDSQLLRSVNRPLTIERVLLSGFDTAGRFGLTLTTNGQPAADLTIRDLAIINPRRPGLAVGGNLIDIQYPSDTADASVVLDGITLAMLPGTLTEWATLFSWDGNDPVFDRWRLARRILLAHVWGNGWVSRAVHIGDGELADVENLCFSDNQESIWPESAPLLHPSTLWNVELSRDEETRGIIRPRIGWPAAGACGARIPGVSRDTWSLRVLHHDPSKWGESWKTSECGNGVVEVGETCDDGNLQDSDGCSAACISDSDLDGIGDNVDNCRSVQNPSQEDSDLDLIGDACDVCPDYRSSNERDTDGNGIGDVCECGDQNADGRVDVRDVIGIYLAQFNPGLITPLCDTNDDARCDVLDIKGVRDRMFGQPTYCSRYPRP